MVLKQPDPTHPFYSVEIIGVTDGFCGGQLFVKGAYKSYARSAS